MYKKQYVWLKFNNFTLKKIYFSFFIQTWTIVTIIQPAETFIYQFVPFFVTLILIVKCISF